MIHIHFNQLKTSMKGHNMPKGVYHRSEALLKKIGDLNRSHNRSKSPEYKAWCHMKARCLDPNNKDYEHYTSRGITICPEWIDSFETFFANMGPRPAKYTLERRNNRLGYTPENCYWGTRKVQAINQGFRCDNPSGFFGVTPSNNPPCFKRTTSRGISKPWRARVGHESKVIELGDFWTAPEAAITYNKTSRKLHGEHAKQNWLPIPSINYGKA